MSFSSGGIPIHTRTLSIALSDAGWPRVNFAAYVLDLRKRGFVPVAGDLQGTGIIHHMKLKGAVDAESLELYEIQADMPTVAFEPTAATGGESCRDRISRVDLLVGGRLDRGWARHVGREIGGPLGCSHVLTLTHLLGPTVAWAVGREEARRGASPREANESFFRRDLTVDGFEHAGRLELLAQLNDLHLREMSASPTAGDRLVEQIEIRASAGLTMGEMQIDSLEITERRRGAASLETAEWIPRPERALILDGAALRSGVSGLLLRGFGDPGEDQPLLDTLLMLAPATVQCMASFRDTWTQLRGVNVAETGGYPDSCYMWRRDGALVRRRSPVA